MIRDLTKREFDTQCRKYGFEAQGFLGYYRLPIPGRHVCASIVNAGSRRRDQLAYLFACLRREQKRGIA